MKIYLTFAAIPLMMFMLLFGIPKLFSVLINTHSDAGIVGIVVIICLLFSIVGAKFYTVNVKEDKNEL